MPSHTNIHSIARAAAIAVVFLSVTAGLSPLHAQALGDALRYSETFPLGTARSLGVGNSMSALGADWSAVAANPAGLAAFRRNEFAITTAGLISAADAPTFQAFATPNTDEQVFGGASPGAASDFEFAIPQVSLVLTRRPIGSKWTQFNFGLGVSQSNRFEERFGFEGELPGSITDIWLDAANGYALDGQGRRAFDEPQDGGPAQFFTNPFSTTDLQNFIDLDLAFLSGVLVPSDDNEVPEEYITDYDFYGRSDVYRPGTPITKRGTVTRTGRNAAIDLSFGANYDEKLMVGATLALSRLRYESAFNYQEVDSGDDVEVFDQLDYNQFSTITGTGVQVRVGAIYRFSQAFRAGLAYHSPSFINVEDSFDANLRYQFTDDEEPRDFGVQRPESAAVLNYGFRSPSQYKASAAGLIGKRGFVSAELTYLNFGGASFGAPDDAFPEDVAAVDTLNLDIEEVLQDAFQVRIGGEANLAPFKLRAGFQYVGAPLGDEDGVLGLNAGVGFRRNRLGLDLGYQTLIRPERNFSPYNIEPVNFPQPRVTYTPISHTVALTVGWKLVSL